MHRHTTIVDSLISVFYLLPNFAADKNGKKVKIVVSGSLGHISTPLTKESIQKGHSISYQN